jgi:PKD repeat protein
VQATGASPTTLRAHAWRAGTTEPSTWQVTATDSTAALQAAGAIGIRSYRSSGTTAGATTDVDDLLVADTAATGANQPPTASFAVTPSARTVSVDGTGSSDPEGAIASYAWTFGDGSTASGATATHAYTADGTFTISLTVTDTGGATGTASRSVTVSARPTQAQWLSDVSAALSGAADVIDAGASSVRPAIVLDVDNTALESYYQPFIATPQVLALEQRAKALGYAVLVATGRPKDTGGTAWQLGKVGYAVTDLCMRDSTSTPVQTAKTACRAGWAAQGYTIVANIGNHAADVAGGNSGRAFVLPDYGFLD